MVINRGELFFRLDQLIGYQLFEDWADDFDGVYAAAEAWITQVTDLELEGLVNDIDALFRQVPAGRDRLAMFPTEYAFDRQDYERYDAWLRAVRQRAAEALAGIDNHPLVDPPS